MSSVSEYNPNEAVLLWLKEKQRHSKVHEKATNQEWYQGVFPEAKADHDQLIRVFHFKLFHIILL